MNPETIISSVLERRFVTRVAYRLHALRIQALLFPESGREAGLVPQAPCSQKAKARGTSVAQASRGDAVCTSSGKLCSTQAPCACACPTSSLSVMRGRRWACCLHWGEFLR